MGLYLHCQYPETCWRISTYFYSFGKIYFIVTRKSEYIYMSFSHGRCFFTFLQQCFKFSLFINVFFVLMARNQQQWHLISHSNKLPALKVRKPTILFVYLMKLCSGLYFYELQIIPITNREAVQEIGWLSLTELILWVNALFTNAN